MILEIKDIDEQVVKDLFPSCDSCLYWEVPEMFGRDEMGEPKVPPDEAIEIKQERIPERTHSFFSLLGFSDLTGGSHIQIQADCRFQ